MRETLSAIRPSLSLDLFSIIRSGKQDEKTLGINGSMYCNPHFGYRVCRFIRKADGVVKTPIDYSPVRPASDGQFHDGLLFAEQSDGTLAYYNTKGQEAFILPDNIKPLSDFFEQRALVINKTTKRIGYINTKGALAVPCKYADGDISRRVWLMCPFPIRINSL